jgi:hypothetical protein
MELIFILLLCFALLFVVEVFLGGALPGESPSRPGCPAPGMGRMGMGQFFGQALPLAMAGIGLPMSLQHHWAVLLLFGAGVLYIMVCKVMKAC